MGVIRGFFLVIVSVLLFLSIFSVILFNVLTSSLTYDNVEKQSFSIAHNFLQKDGNLTQTISKNYPYLEIYCQNNSEYVFNAEGYAVTIPCTNVTKSQDEFINAAIISLTKQIYYAPYNCNFIDCFKSGEVPVFLISKHTYDFFNGKLILFSIISFILSILLFLLVEKKANSFLLLGIFSIISSLPFFKLDIWLNSISNQMIAQSVDLFLSQAFSIALGFLVLGIVLVITSIVWKIFNLGFLISNLISKFTGKKELTKNNIKKSSKPKSK